MSKTEQSVYLKRFKEEECLEDRIALIARVCQVFAKGFLDGIFTFKELRGACRFLRSLISAIDKDAGDLCLLASHAENVEQFKSICKMSRQRWTHIDDEEREMEDSVPLKNWSNLQREGEYNDST